MLDFCFTALYNERVIRSPIWECGLNRAIQSNKASSLLCKVIHTTKHSGLFFLYRVLKCLQTLNRTARSYQLGTSRVIAETNFDTPAWARAGAPPCDASQWGATSYGTASDSMTAGVKSCVRFYRVGRSDIRGSGRQNQPYSKKWGGVNSLNRSPRDKWLLYTI